MNHRTQSEKRIKDPPNGPQPGALLRIKAFCWVSNNRDGIQLAPGDLAVVLRMDKRPKGLHKVYLLISDFGMVTYHQSSPGFGVQRFSYYFRYA